MSTNPHDQARAIIALVGEDLPPAQGVWLHTHLAECPSCQAYADEVGQVVRTLRSKPFTADPALVEAARQQVRARALQLRQQRERLQLVCVSCLLVGVSAAITTPLFWQIFAWLGTSAGVSPWIWQTGFAAFWLAPALLASLFLLAHGHALPDHNRTL